MNKEYTIKDENGTILNVSLIGCFQIPDLDKEYAIYSMKDNDENNDMGYAMIGEMIKEEDGTLRVKGIAEHEKEIVLAYYNEVADQLGGEVNGNN